MKIVSGVVECVIVVVCVVVFVVCCVITSVAYLARCTWQAAWR